MKSHDAIQLCNCNFKSFPFSYSLICVKIFPFMQIGAGMARRVFWLFNTGNMKEILNVLARLEK